MRAVAYVFPSRTCWLLGKKWAVFGVEARYKNIFGSSHGADQPFLYIVLRGTTKNSCTNYHSVNNNIFNSDHGLLLIL